MQRKPKLAKALAQMTAAVWDPEGEIDRGFKRIIAHVASRAAGSNIAWPTPPPARCTLGSRTRSSRRSGNMRRAHSIAKRSERRSNALAAASVPNAVTDAMFAELRKYWTEEQIVEIVGVIALFGFLNRWNDTMATPLEDEPIEVAEKYLARDGWTIGVFLK